MSKKSLKHHFSSPKWKGLHEFAFWKQQKNIEGTFSNDHYEFLFTEHFGFNLEAFRDKTILDIGCGPRGSLEWAQTAKRRIGIDPLADKYVKELDAQTHQMEYIQGGSENIPLEDASCDMVYSLNSLDHVDDLEATIKEIKRCTASKGFFMVLVEVNHEPRICEPHSISPIELIQKLEPEFEGSEYKLYAENPNGIYRSIKKKLILPNPLSSEIPGYFTAKFRRD